MKDGILVLYKEKDMTSFDAVSIVRKLFGTKKAGHTGTLDPQATGVLPVLVGEAVKISEFVLTEKKKYRAGINFGLFTDTEDIWGKPTAFSEDRTDEEEFSTALSSFVGDYMQVPPMMSAIKINGKKLYEYQRQGIEIEREARPCKIFSAKTLFFDKDRAEIEVECSKGTYIRTFIFDLMKKIGIKGCMSSLERTESAGFTLEDAVPISKLRLMTVEEREKYILPTESFFSDKKILSLSDFNFKLIKNGCTVLQKKLGSDIPEGETVRLYGKDGFFGLGRSVMTEDGAAIKKIKEFR